MRTSPLELTSMSFEDTINNGNIPILIDLWAPWCVPCKTMGPVIDKLAAKSNGKIIIAKIDVEQYPEFLKKHAVRGIPSLLLFNQKKEVSRKTGIQSLSQLNMWLSEHGIDLLSQPIIKHSEPLDWGSFYDDAELADFFKKRLLGHAEKKEIIQSIDSYWDKNSGTLSAAFVHSSDPVNFERMTGLPISLARLLDKSGIETPTQISSLFYSLSSGKDYRLIASQFMYYFISSSFSPWGQYTQDHALNMAVQQWIELSNHKFNGIKVTSEQWLEFNHKVKALLSEYSTPELRLEHNLATLLINLSTNPDSNDDESWSVIARLLHFIKYQVLQIQNGWTKEERALPDLRFQWFTEKERNTVSGKLSDFELKKLRDEWQDKNSDFIEKENKFHQNLNDYFVEIDKHSQDKLFQLLNDAPDY